MAVRGQVSRSDAVEIDGGENRPNRWVTPLAMRVLNWYSAYGRV
jgi:hypothetical protein